VNGLAKYRGTAPEPKWAIGHWGEMFQTSVDHGPRRRVSGVGLSLWPLLALSALVGLGWTIVAVRRGEPDGDPSPRRRTVRRLVRPWLWTAAVAGVICVTAHGLSTGPIDWRADVTRGPADGPHPRLFEASISGVHYGPIGTSFERTAPGFRVWRTSALNGGPPAPDGASAIYELVILVVSLWWLLPAGLLANAVTLWRMRRRSGTIRG
jgi:hypothetical protein